MCQLVQIKVGPTLLFAYLNYPHQLNQLWSSNNNNIKAVAV